MAKLRPISEIFNNKRIEFRHIQPNDAESFLSFKKQVPHDSPHTMQYIGQNLPTIKEITQWLLDRENDEVTLIIGAFEESKVIGYLNFRKPYPDHPWVQHLGQFGMMILKEFWGLGIGKKLLQLQEAHALKLGVIRLEAMVRINNERGLILYQRSGYEIEGTRRKAAKIENKFYDEYYIAKIFE